MIKSSVKQDGLLTYKPVESEIPADDETTEQTSSKTNKETEVTQKPQLLAPEMADDFYLPELEFDYEEDVLPETVEGNITYIKQLHARDGQNKILRVLVGVYQYKVLQYLVKHEVKNIFVEGFTENVLPDHYLRDNSAVQQSIKDLFPEGWEKVKTPSQEQAFKLADPKFGAAVIYAYLHDDVSLFLTITKSEDEIIKFHFTEKGAEGAIKHIVGVRDKLAMREVKRRFKDGAIDNAAIIFGALHELKPLLEGIGLTVKEQSWPRLLKEHDKLVLSQQ